jgi:hypothetical protein
MRILDHGVEPAGDGIVVVAYLLSAALVAASGVAFWLWRRGDRESARK